MILCRFVFANELVAHNACSQARRERETSRVVVTVAFRKHVLSCSQCDPVVHNATEICVEPSPLIGVYHVGTTNIIDTFPRWHECTLSLTLKPEMSKHLQFVFADQTAHTKC